jgi:hypothetical protein
MPRAWWCFARAAIRTGESSDDLKSWLLERLTCSSTGWVHLCDRLLRSRRGTPPHSLRPRIPRSSCIIPAGLHGPRPDGSMPASSRRTVQPFDFPEISLFPLRASASRAAFQGIALQNGSCALRPEQLQVYRSNDFCASPSRSVTWRTYPLPAPQAPPKSLWATSPPRKMALGPLQASHWPPKCPLRSCPGGLRLGIRGL